MRRLATLSGKRMISCETWQHGYNISANKHQSKPISTKRCNKGPKKHHTNVHVCYCTASFIRLFVKLCYVMLLVLNAVSATWAI